MAQIMRKRFLVKSLIILLVITTASCGTLMYPERRGQTAGRLDAGVVALDAVGLLLFFVPGVVAFAVDFATGTIYLPPERMVIVPSYLSLQTIEVNPAELTPQRLEAIVGERLGQQIHLEPGSYRAAHIGQIQDFNTETLNRLQSTPGTANVTFRGTSE